MKKIFLKTMVIVMLTVLMLGISMLFVGCVEEEEKEPVFEIKLYDDNWQELEKSGRLTYKEYIVKYDGTRKLCNAIVYKDEKEIYRLDYKTNPNYYYDRCLEVCEYRNDFNEVIKDKMPYKVGEYKLIYQYSSYGYSKNINCFASNPLPIKYYQDRYHVKLCIVE